MIAKIIEGIVCVGLAAWGGVWGWSLANRWPRKDRHKHFPKRGTTPPGW